MSKNEIIFNRLMESNLFFASFAQAPSMLGFGKKRTGIYRIKKRVEELEKAEEINLEEISFIKQLELKSFVEYWERLKEVFALTDADIYQSYYILEKRKWLHKILYPEVKMHDPASLDNAMIALFTEHYSLFSEYFQEHIVPVINEFRKADIVSYLKVLSLFYIQKRDINVYKAKDIKQIKQYIQEWSELCRKAYPESLTGKIAVENYFGILDSLDSNTTFCTYEMMQAFSNILGQYSIHNFESILLKGYHLFNIPINTYWIEEGTPFEEGAYAYNFFAYSPGNTTNGCYVVPKLKLVKNDKRFTPEETRYLLFQQAGTEDVGILTTYNIQLGTKYMSSYQYQFIKEESLLLLTPLKIHPEDTTILPARLQMVDITVPDTPKQTKWQRALRLFEKEYTEEFIQQTMTMPAYGQMNFDYEIVDIMIGRRNFQIVVKDKNNQEIEFSIPIDKHKILKNITINDQILLMEKEEDNTIDNNNAPRKKIIYLTSAERGFYIPLDQFSKRIISTENQ